MTALRTIVVDDEPPARARLRRLLAGHADIAVVAEADSVASGVACIRAQRPQLLFLDIALGSGNGFQLLQRLDAPPPVVFTTAYHEHAVRAFEVAAIDYLLKPFDGERLAISLQRVRQRLAGDVDGEADERLRRLRGALPELPALRRLVVHERGRRLVVPIEAVVRLSAAGNYVEVTTANGRHLVRATLARIAQRLDPRHWLRVHRSHIVRADFVAATAPCGHGDLRLTLHDGSELTLTRRFRKLLPDLA